MLRHVLRLESVRHLLNYEPQHDLKDIILGYGRRIQNCKGSRCVITQLHSLSERLPGKTTGSQLAATQDAPRRLKPLRIVLVMLEPPLPYGNAAARWYYVLLKGLTERGHKVTAFATCSKFSEAEHAQQLFPAAQYDLRCHLHPHRDGLTARLETLRRPYSYMFDAELRQDLRNELVRGCDVLHLEQLWSGWVGLAYAHRAVMNVHYLTEIDLANAPGSPREKLTRALARRAAKYLLAQYPFICTLTPRLSKRVKEISPRSRVHTVPLSLDLSLYPMVKAERIPARPVVTMIGSMDWYPSRSAAERLITRLWPEIKSHTPEAHLQIVGWHARKVLQPYLRLPGVTVIEDVPEARPYFEASTVFLYAPERGSGMKVKILEAFAYGVPVVTNSEGVEGLPVQDGVHAGICDDDRGLVERTIALLGDRDLQERRRRTARALLETHCNPNVVLSRLECCYADLLRLQHECTNRDSLKLPALTER
jgi:glycosyltransferase involved in cell wall biosynthesis